MRKSSTKPQGATSYKETAFGIIPRDKLLKLEIEAYVASLTDEDLEKDVDMSSFGMETKKVYDFIANLISGHLYPITGEISVLKGIQGLKGYPF
ncbi:MAG TPA: hypothetical protein VF941_06235 [Clostridia bacterium]